MAADILRVEGLCKSFGEAVVLDNISFSVASNSIVGIVGENGAGKSTLFNVISGIVRPDRGRIEYRGKEIHPANYKEANLLGISRVFQEQALIPNIAVYENILLSHEARFAHFGQILDRRRMVEAAQTVSPADVDERTLHGLMVGRERDSDYYHEEEQGLTAGRPNMLEVRGLSHADHYKDVSFAIREGEVLGIGGLLDSGKSHLGKGIAGLVSPETGAVRFGTNQPGRPDFQDLISKGLAYVPSERLSEGIILPFSVSWNTSLAGGQDLFTNRLGFWHAALEERVTRRYMKELGVKARSPRSSCATLSGGNQQKVVLAKWLCRSPRAIILDNPTRGIDAGAKEEVYKLVRQITKSGACVVLISDELLELIGLSHRIAVMRGGRLTEILDAPPENKPSERELVAHMLGA